MEKQHFIVQTQTRPQTILHKSFFRNNIGETALKKQYKSTKHTLQKPVEVHSEDTIPQIPLRYHSSVPYCENHISETILIYSSETTTQKPYFKRSHTADTAETILHKPLWKSLFRNQITETILHKLH